jgi:hypothetical protein
MSQSEVGSEGMCCRHSKELARFRLYGSKRLPNVHIRVAHGRLLSSDLEARDGPSVPKFFGLHRKPSEIPSEIDPVAYEMWILQRGLLVNSRQPVRYEEHSQSSIYQDHGGLILHMQCQNVRRDLEHLLRSSYLKMFGQPLEPCIELLLQSHRFRPVCREAVIVPNCV